MLGRVMSECEDSDGLVGSIASRTGFDEAIEGAFCGPEGVYWSALCLGAAIEGGSEERVVDVEVSGVGRGVVVPELSMSHMILAIARSAEVTG